MSLVAKRGRMLACTTLIGLVFVSLAVPLKGRADTAAPDAAGAKDREVWRVELPDGGSGGGYDEYAEPDRWRLAVDPQGEFVALADGSEVAYDAETGDELWAYQPTSAGNMIYITDHEISPDGGAIFLGTSSGSETDPSVEVIALDPVTGLEMWRASSAQLGGWHVGDVASDGTRVFAWVSHNGVKHVIALDAATGAKVWESDEVGTLAVDPDQGRLYVVGRGAGVALAVTALRTTTGETLWKRRLAPGTNPYDIWAEATPGGKDLTVLRAVGDGTTMVTSLRSRDGMFRWQDRLRLEQWGGVETDNRKVYVSGGGWITRYRESYRTVAYDSIDGRRVWARTWGEGVHDGDLGDYDYDEEWATASVLSSDGKRLYVTGAANKYPQCENDLSCHSEFGTVAYATADGRLLWSKRLYGGSYSQAESIGVSPQGGLVYVYGASLYRSLIVAYRG